MNIWIAVVVALVVFGGLFWHLRAIRADANRRAAEWVDLVRGNGGNFTMECDPDPAPMEPLMVETGEAPAIRLEVGKQYRRRDGVVVTAEDNPFGFHPFRVGRWYYHADGRHCVDVDSYRKYDLIAEVAPEASTPTVKESLPTAFTLRPDWSKAPEWAMWAAQDGDGAVWLYEKEPLRDESTEWEPDGWYEPSRGGLIYEQEAVGPANPNWRQAIEARPVAELSHAGDAASYSFGSDMAFTVDETGFFEFSTVSDPANFEPEFPAGVSITLAEYERLQAIEKTARTYHKTGSGTARNRLGKALGVKS